MGAFHPESRVPSETMVPLCPNCHDRRVDSMDHEGFCSESCFLVAYPHGVGEETSGGKLSLQNKQALDRFQTDVEALETESKMSWKEMKEKFKTDNVVAARARWEALNKSRSPVANMDAVRRERKGELKKRHSVSRGDRYKEAA